MLSKRNIEDAVLGVYQKIDNSFISPLDNSLDESQLWNEIVFSILSSRVKYELALASFNNLKKSKIINDPHKIIVSVEIVSDIESILKSPVSFFYNEKECISSFPFPKQRAKYIFRTAQNIYSHSSILEIIKSSPDAKYMREKLINICIGLGPKQISMCLNNFITSNNLAVLDAHILSYLKLLHIIKLDVMSVSSLRLYETIENKFIDYANKLSANIKKLDLSIWIVMRTIKRNFLNEYRNLSLRWS